MTFVACSALFCLLPMPGTVAQESPSKPAEIAPAFQEAQDVAIKSKLHLDVHLMVVPVWIDGTNPNPRSGKLPPLYQVPINKFDREEFFWLKDGGKQRDITVLREAETPLRLGIVLDASRQVDDSSLSFFKSYIKDVLEKELRPADRFFLMAINHEPQWVVPDFSQAQPHAGKSLKAIKHDGDAPLYREAMAQAFSKFADSGARVKKILLVICPAHDAGRDLSPKTWDEINNLGARSNAQVFVLSPSRADRGHPAGDLAGLTGGKVFFVNPEELSALRAGESAPDKMNQRLRGLFSSIKEEILIAYSLDAEEVAPGNWRNIEVGFNPDPAVQKRINQIKTTEAQAHVLQDKIREIQQLNLVYPSRRYIP